MSDEKYASDLTPETSETLDGNEYFVMFDSTEGKKAKLSEVIEYIDDNIDASNIIDTVKVNGTALTPDSQKAVDIPLASTSAAGAMSSSDKTKLNGIDEGADVNVIEAVKVDGEALEINNKAVDIVNKAEINGYYDDLYSGTSGQLLSNIYYDDNAPYVFRTAGGSLDVGNRKLEELVGGTVAWNQLAEHGNFDTASGWSGGTVSGNVLTLTGTSDGTLNLTLSRAMNIPSGHKTLVMCDVYCGSANIARTRYPFISLSTVSVSANTWTSFGQIGISDTLASVGVQMNGINGETYKYRNFVCFDLTAMFGSTIADYIYALEQATTGAGVAWFKKYFPKPYYAYNAGTLMSVKAFTHITTGFNQWDEEWEVGTISTTTGANESSSNRIRSKNYIRVVPNTTYSITGFDNGRLVYYDADKNFIQYVDVYSLRPAPCSFTTPPNCAYIRFSPVSAYGTTYKNDICINLSWDGERDGEYEPYQSYSYSLDSSLDLRGLCKLDEDNNLYFDGDTYESDGTVTRKYGYVDLGTLTWSYWSSQDLFYTTLPNKKPARTMGCLCSSYLESNPNSWGDTPDKSFVENASWDTLYVKDLDYTTAASFKTAVNGVQLVYPLATPTTESAAPYANPMTIHDFGTELWVDGGVSASTRDVSIPVGHNTKYVPDLKAKLEMAPNSPDEDGLYLMKHQGGLNTYVPEPFTASKADIDGYYEDMTVGSANQLLSNITIEDQVPYNFRTAGGSADIGDREYDTIVGGTVAWNQLIKNGNFVDTSAWSSAGYGGITVSGNVGTLTLTDVGSSVRIEQSLTPVRGHKYFCSVDINTPYVSNHTVTFYSTGSNWIARTLSAPANTWVTTAGIKNVSSDENISGVIRLYCGSASSQVGDTIKFRNVMLIDLTAMFGSTIADYIYSLETANAGAGVAWFRKLFPKPYYAYNAGELMSVNASAHNTVGFNQFDPITMDLAQGSFDYRDATNTNNVSCYGYIPFVPNATYFWHDTVTANGRYVRFYDADKQLLPNASISKYSTVDFTFTVPPNAMYGRVMWYVSSGSILVSDIVNGDFCINLSWDGERDGEYEEYVKHSYPLDSGLTLRGIPKLDASNNLYYDGDVYSSDGTVERRFNILDLGTLTWKYQSSYGGYLDASLPSGKEGKYRTNTFINGICARYRFNGTNTSGSAIANYEDKTMVLRSSDPLSGTSTRIFIKDSAYSDGTTFKAAMSGVYFVYELATGSTESAEPYQSMQIVDDFGTEEYVIDSEITVPVPVGHVTKYQPNLRAKLEMSPNSPDGDGDYIVRQTNGENEYVPLVIPTELPTLPTEDGTYRLQVVVSGSTKTLSWVSGS